MNGFHFDAVVVMRLGICKQTSLYYKENLLMIARRMTYKKGLKLVG